MDKALIAYTAGFFDGEGCIYVNPHGYLQLFIANTCMAALHSLRRSWGELGHISSWQSKKHPHYKPKHSWTIGGKQAGYFLRQIRDHLLIKTVQADLALELLSLGIGKGRRLSGKNLERQQYLRAEIRNINRKAHPPVLNPKDVKNDDSARSSELQVAAD